jgi:hypothetical protein
MTHDVIVALAVLGVVGQVLGAGLLLIGALALVGVRGPLRALRSGVEGYELWLAFVVAAIATGGSLFFSEIAHFTCWSKTASSASRSPAGSRRRAAARSSGSTSSAT